MRRMTIIPPAYAPSRDVRKAARSFAEIAATHICWHSERRCGHKMPTGFKARLAEHIAVIALADVTSLAEAIADSEDAPAPDRRAQV